MSYMNMDVNLSKINKSLQVFLPSNVIFFIYCFLGYSLKSILVYINQFSSPFLGSLCFFIFTFLFLSLLVFGIFNNFFPRLLSLLTGNRNSRKS
ncbi:hypothetical protein SAMN05720469_11454 [Fibrobacter intestinalis]|uniref:Uncharacterized protein n=1 Tax=Fibrobacter intestinalis TaxID=28122 RepID=A0A1M6ULF4_9BACT|nr:hypothetical protein SAMN05720469_11454 [Fibrobacter intestinalis]